MNKPASDQRLHGLYAITDENLIPEADFVATIEKVLAGGAAIIQYRDKSSNKERRFEQASALRKLCDKHHSILIINDDIALAKSVNADGVHLGMDDMAIQEARSLLGNDAIIGVSCYNQLERAREAQRLGADYIAFGAMYVSPTKPKAAAATPALIAESKEQIELPVCAIGGITENNAQEIIDAGADMIAVISGLFGARDIEAAARTLAGLYE